MIKKTLIPNDLRDFLSIISFIGFVAIFFKFALQNSFLSETMDAIFLILAGVGLLVIGKAFTIHKWVKDGIQRNEILQIFVIIFGLPSVIIGVLLLFNIALPLTIKGFIGFLALGPAMFILIDYIAKN